MKNIELIKEFFFQNAEDNGLIVKNRNDLKVSSYSVNNEIFGIQSFFLGDIGGLKLLIKKGRNDFFDFRYREKIRRLAEYCSDNKHPRLIGNMIVGREIEINGERYILQDFIKWKNAYLLFRNSLTWQKKLSYIRLALDFCQSLELCSQAVASLENEWSKISEIYKRSNGAEGEESRLSDRRTSQLSSLESARLKVGLVHNDLVPSNFLVAAQDYRVIDWEYWDTSLSIFNFFDVLLSFGSLLRSKLFSRRSVGNYWRIFTDGWSGRGARFLKMCGEYCERVGYLEIPADLAKEVFFLYLMNKSVCQYKVYGSRFNLDNFWSSLLKDYCQYSPKICDFWNTLISWRSL
jgi:serine/threonine protein kinase